MELETSRGKVLLYDSSASKASLQPHGRHDFIVRHDVKEVGQHTLICSVSYVTAEGERRFLPQYFKFTSSNPLSVRTKVSGAGHSGTVLRQTSPLYNAEGVATPAEPNGTPQHPAGGLH